MKNKYRLKLIIFCVISLTLSSCVNITKRVHRGGFYVEWDLANMKIHANKKGEIDEEPLLKTLNNQTKRINEKKITDRKKDLETKHFVISSNEYIRNEQNNKTISKEVKIADSKTNLKVEDFSNESTKSKEKDRYLLWLFGGTALLTLATFKKGKKISFWAKKNKRKAQAIVGLSATLLPVVSFMHGWVGEYDQSIDLKIGAFSALGLLSWGTYLHKKTNKTYLGRKLKEIIFLIALVGFFNSLGNKYSNHFNNSKQNISVEKSVKNNFVLSTFEKADEGINSLMTIFGNVFLSVLLLLITYLLELIVLFTACSLACSGYGILAACLAISGTIGVLSLLIFGLINIWKKNRGRREDLTDAEKAENRKVSRNVIIFVLLMLFALLIISIV